MYIHPNVRFISILLWLIVVTASIIMMGLNPIIGTYMLVGLILVGGFSCIFYNYVAQRELYHLRNRPTPVVVYPEHTPPLVIVEGNKVSHIGIPMESNNSGKSPVPSMYVPIYVAHVN